MPMAYDIEGTVYQGGSATLLARVVGADGSPLTPDGLSAASYTVEQLDDNDDQASVAVTGHTDVSLTPSDIVLSPMQTDVLWTIDAEGYNFRHVLDVSSHEAFPEAGRRYRITYRLTPNSGQVILVRYNLLAI